MTNFSFEQELFLLAEDYAIKSCVINEHPWPTRVLNQLRTRDWLLEFYNKAEKLKSSFFADLAKQEQDAALVHSHKNTKLTQEKELNEMPTPFSITKEDVASAKAGQPGWYLLHVNDLSSGPGTNDPNATTHTFTMVIKDGPDKTVIGAKVKHYLSEKTPPAFSIPFIEAVTAKRFPETGAAPDLEKMVGRDVKAHLTWDTKFKSWKADDFMPAVGKVEP